MKQNYIGKNVFRLYETQKMLYNGGYNKLGGMAMNCMKCGRETQEENVFCQSCLLVMDRYPIQPGTVVLLPRHRESSVNKKNIKRRTLSAEEKNYKLRKIVKVLSILLTIAVIAIVLMIKPTIHYMMDDHFEIGQNYSSVIQSETTAAKSP